MHWLVTSTGEMCLIPVWSLASAFQINSRTRRNKSKYFNFTTDVRQKKLVDLLLFSTVWPCLTCDFAQILLVVLLTSSWQREERIVNRILPIVLILSCNHCHAALWEHIEHKMGPNMKPTTPQEEDAADTWSTPTDDDLSWRYEVKQRRTSERFHQVSKAADRV